LTNSSPELEKLFHPATIRSQADRIAKLAMGGATHFQIHPHRLSEVVERVARITKANYPSLDVPFHSRWRHFQAGGIDRNRELDRLLSSHSEKERLCAKLDLAIVSVLLDAGAGPSWKYREENNTKAIGRSEGLAIASFRMFLSGSFSSPKDDPLRVDADALERLSISDLETGFQVDTKNPMLGMKGRHGLLKSLAQALRKASPNKKNPRPGDIIDEILLRTADAAAIQARLILRSVQEWLGPIWPGRLEWAGVNLGDVWNYPPLGSGVDSMIPFHKLSQWLSYSLVEPIMESGQKVAGLDELTGLAEYRNGGLLLDSGLITLRNPALATISHAPGSELVVEWRALTIYFLDQIWPLACQALNKKRDEFPLVKILEGGTWWAGRELAFARSPEGEPPLKIISDGTVF
jgi:hypothetical protein